MEQGNIVWGSNWDIIFPIANLYSGNLTKFKLLLFKY